MSTTTLCLSSGAASAAPRFTAPGILTVWFNRARSRARDRDAIGRMTERDFHDIGVSRSVIADELAKPFWRG